MAKVLLSRGDFMAEIMPHWLTKQATLSPNRPAIEMVDGSVITFYELMQQSQELSKKIANLGIEKGSHVGILSNNDPTMIRLVHALSYLGAVAVLLITRLPKEELNYQVNDAKINTVISQDDLLEKANQLNSNQII